MLVRFRVGTDDGAIASHLENLSQQMFVFNYTNGAKKFRAFMHYLGSKSVAAYLSLFMLNVSKRTLGRDSIFIFEDEDVLIISEETVNIFEGAIRGFGVK